MFENLCRRELMITFDRKIRPKMEKLFRKYYQPLCYFADGLLLDSDLSEETVQDAFVRIISSRTEFENEKHFRSYVYATVRNACLAVIADRQRSVRADIEESETVIAPESDSSDYDVVRAEIIRMIREAIDSLSPRYRQVFVMAYVDGMKNEEIAEALGISLNTVKVIRQRSKARMREMLKDLFPLIFIFAEGWRY